MRTLDVHWTTCRERWMIGADEKRESGKSMLTAQFDDDEIKYGTNIEIWSADKELNQY